MKGLVLLSVLFGIVVAPFAVYSASRALHRHRNAAQLDAPAMRQLVLLRRLAVGLLIFWAFVIGARVAWLRAV